MLVVVVILLFWNRVVSIILIIVCKLKIGNNLVNIFNVKFLVIYLGVFCILIKCEYKYCLYLF